jgi:hypothetical protein
MYSEFARKRTEAIAANSPASYFCMVFFKRFIPLSLMLLVTLPLSAQNAPDTDHDGLNDALEQRLLVQFAPEFRIGQHDCSNVPATFTPGLAVPTVQAEDRTIYGQVFVSKNSTPVNPSVEIHYYHLWKTDCGPHGHALDAEHVATLVHADRAQLDDAKWKADYWYAAAHEDTVCDVSQITRARTLQAEDHGAKVWISPGKHASYLNETLCRAGCGADHCLQMTELHAEKIVNLGEVGAPMNGSLFISSKQWPLVAKMTVSNFPGTSLERVNGLPETDIAWVHPGSHPTQQIIAISGHTEQHIASAGSSVNSHTGDALDSADGHTGVAISLAADQTGNALQKSFHKTVHALSSAAKHTGDALHVTENADAGKAKTETPH